MKIYEIIDGELQRSIGFLLYYETANTFVIELSSTLTEWEAPLLFAGHVGKGIFTIPRAESLLWVRERVIPPGRQNIGEILGVHHLEQYREADFLELSHGRCAQDSMYIRKADCLPDYILQRQQKNLDGITPLENCRLLCFFADRKVKVVSVRDLENEPDVPKILRSPALFDSAALTPGGYAAAFNDSIDIAAAKLYHIGIDMPLTAGDFRTFAQKSVLSAAESCALLQCSRQNLAYLAKKGRLEPLKKENGGSFYLKGDLERLRQ